MTRKRKGAVIAIASIMALFASIIAISVVHQVDMHAEMARRDRLFHLEQNGANE